MQNLEQVKIKLLNHEYELIQQIGKGAFSNIFLCRSLRYNDLFCIKRISNDKFKEFEISTLCHLSHPYIIQLYETFNDEEAQYLVMEYCPNDTIKGKKKLEYDKFIYYSKQILEALSFCHSQNIAHRDIKPDNIFIDKYDRIKLADFGFAKKFDKNITSNEHCGSLMYCSPEIIQNKALFNPFKADIYALGITFFYMITGEYPFPNDSVTSLKRSILYTQIDFTDYDVDEEVQRIITRMTFHSPELRPSVDDLLKLPIYEQTKPKITYFYGKKDQKGNSPINLYTITCNKSTPCLPLSHQLMPSVRKKRIPQRKFYCHKCDLVCPNIQKINFQF